MAVAPVAIARGLLHDLREQHEVTAATLAGVLAIYLLAGMFFSFVYGVIGAVDSDALFAQLSDPTARTSSTSASSRSPRSATAT